METKKELRTKYQGLRRALNEEERETLSAEICGHILGSRLYQEADTIYMYHPLGSEVSLLPVAKDALATGRTVAFPKVTGDDMAFYTVNCLGALQEGAYHIMEPAGGTVVETEHGLVLVPGLVFDMDGNRIGYGKGYYDRYLSEHRRLVTLGCAYELQVIENFEADGRDEQMDYLVTELGIRKFGTACENL